MTTLYNKRIETIARHLDIQEDVKIVVGDNKIDDVVPKVDVHALKMLIDDPKLTKVRDQVRQFIQREPLFSGAAEAWTDTDTYKTLVFNQVKALANSGIVKFTDVRDGVDRLGAILEILGMYNNNVCTKLIVHYSLFGGTVLLLGTARHEQQYASDADSLKIVGCFSMTEVGHGSNVRGLETTATYDATSKTFVINSPTRSSAKFWIGGAGMHGHFTTVFARLLISGADKGIHAFVVPIRDANLRLLPGVEIKDCGHKMGLNGIDNGNLRFGNVRIPRTNLLNRFSDVSEEGVYTSQFATPIKNFAATMAPFIGGRLFITRSTGGAVKSCLAIALRYAHIRKQFGPSEYQELPLITLPTHQRRLMVPLARTIVLDLFTQLLADQIQSGKIPVSAHAHCSGIKAIYSWHGLETMQNCRECCGGQGFRAVNRICQFRTDCDVNVTYEGDNTVLMQQVAKYVLALKSAPLASMPYLDGDAKRTLYNLNNVLALFKARESLRTKELREVIAQSGKDAYAAFNAAIPWALKVATAHMDVVILENTMHKINSTSNIQPLAHLAVLDVLAKIELDAGWFLSHQLISADIINSIPYLISDLCALITLHSLSIIEAFDIPQK
eukprot:gene9116-10691_t